MNLPPSLRYGLPLWRISSRKFGNLEAVDRIVRRLRVRLARARRPRKPCVRSPWARPDVVLMDIFCPACRASNAPRGSKALLPRTQIVILTAVDDEELVYRAFEKGADGYLSKRTRPDHLRTALLDVSAGAVPMSSEIARRLMESSRLRAQTRADGTHLSRREEEVLGLLSQGYSNQEVADRLGLSVDTVRGHLKSIYQKMHVCCRTKDFALGMAQPSRLDRTSDLADKSGAATKALGLSGLEPTAQYELTDFDVAGTARVFRQGALGKGPGCRD